VTYSTFLTITRDNIAFADLRPLPSVLFRSSLDTGHGFVQYPCKLVAADVKKEIHLEIAHVLFCDIVGYSKVPSNEQRALRDTLNQVVRSTEEFRTADSDGRLIKIPSGDGLALVFYKSPEEPMECALEISRALKEHPNLQLRMGIHSGPVSSVVDVNNRPNLAGTGLNMAQRVVQCLIRSGMIRALKN